MQEIWKDIRDYEGLYQISNKGNVKSLNYNHTGREEILKLSVDKRGYLIVRLCNNRKLKFLRVHRLVAEAFIPNPNNYPCVNHKDEDKTNNCISNLEFCSVKYNNNYGTRLERILKKTTNGKCSKPVLKIDPISNEIVAEFPSINEVQRQLGLTHISECCKGKRNTAGKYKWQYKSTT